MRLLILLIVLFSFPSHADIANNAEAINQAGKQRMLGQRIVKAYIMVGSDVKANKAQKELDESIALFEQHHLELMEYAPNKSIYDALNQVSEIWMPFRLKAVQEPQASIAEQLIIASDELFKASNNVVFLLEKYAQSNTAKLVNTSGKQRMLSQKIAKLYMAMAWKLNSENLKRDFEKTLQDYEAGLNQLNQAPENSAQIKKKLAKVNAQWQFSKAGFSQHESGRFVPTLISVTTDSMLKKMNELTLEYQKLSEKS